MEANLEWELSKYPDVYESLNSKSDLAKYYFLSLWTKRCAAMGTPFGDFII